VAVERSLLKYSLIVPPKTENAISKPWIRNGRARELSPNFQPLPYLLAPYYLIKASRVCCEEGVFWARNSASARLCGSL
jgi:hypothetical protein